MLAMANGKPALFLARIRTFPLRTDRKITSGFQYEAGWTI
jgi:hypothetical protein